MPCPDYPEFVFQITPLGEVVFEKYLNDYNVGDELEILDVWIKERNDVAVPDVDARPNWIDEYTLIPPGGGEYTGDYVLPDETVENGTIERATVEWRFPVSLGSWQNELGNTLLIGVRHTDGVGDPVEDEFCLTYEAAGGFNSALILNDQNLYKIAPDGDTWELAISGVHPGDANNKNGYLATDLDGGLCWVYDDNAFGADGRNIKRYDLNAGTGQTGTLVFSGSINDFIAVPSTSELFLIVGNTSLRTIPFGGTGATEVYASASNMRGLAYDPVTDRIYWYEIDPDTLYSADPSDVAGTKTTLLSGTTTPDGPGSVHIDQRIYWNVPGNPHEMDLDTPGAGFSAWQGSGGAIVPDGAGRAFFGAGDHVYYAVSGEVYRRGYPTGPTEQYPAIPNTGRPVRDMEPGI